uniref:Uncharacterized protein n=1 Tax=Anguilla anguilla TaxID=7936 RepID=A0A0E9W975_ANGAN
MCYLPYSNELLSWVCYTKMSSLLSLLTPILHNPKAHYPQKGDVYITTFRILQRAQTNCACVNIPNQALKLETTPDAS